MFAHILIFTCLSRKYLLVKSPYPESLRFLCLWGWIEYIAYNMEDVPQYCSAKKSLTMGSREPKCCGNEEETIKKKSVHPLHAQLFPEKYAKAGFVRSTSALQLHFSSAAAAAGLCGWRSLHQITSNHLSPNQCKQPIVKDCQFMVQMLFVRLVLVTKRSVLYIFNASEHKT